MGEIFTPEVMSAIFGVVGMVLVAVVGYVGRATVAYLEAREVQLGKAVDSATKEGTYNRLIDIAGTAVLAARDKAREYGWTGEEQREYAIKVLTAHVDEAVETALGVEFDETLAEDLIRSVYQAILGEAGSFDPGIEIVD